MSIIEIMIDNYVDIFGDEDHIICDNNKKRSNDLKMSVNTAGKSAVIKKSHRWSQWETLNANTAELKISSTAPHAEVPTV